MSDFTVGWLIPLLFVCILGSSEVSWSQPVEVSLKKTYTSPNPTESSDSELNIGIGEESGGFFGDAVAGIGDMNGDGESDLLVGAPFEGNGGRAYLISGDNGKIVRALSSPNPQTNGQFGATVARVGDVDGDGLPDMLIGASDEGSNITSSTTIGPGRIYILSGRTSRVLHRLTPNAQLRDWFGRSAAKVGSDEDGVSNLLIGVPGEDVNRKDETGQINRKEAAGQAYIRNVQDERVLRRISSPSPSEDGSFGSSVAGIRDFNGDGVSDLVIGADGETVGGVKEAGRVYIFGGNDGEVLRKLDSPNPDANGEMESRTTGGKYYEGADFGTSVTGVGDVNSDGTPDLLVGSSETIDGVFAAGRAYLLSGVDGEVLHSFVSPNLEKQGRFGESVSVIGNSEDSSPPDLLIGATEESGGVDNAGRVYRYELSTNDGLQAGSNQEIERTKEPKNELDPDNLPETSASVEFTEPSGNNRLDGGETATISLTVHNDGDGPARRVKAQVQPERAHPHLSYSNSITFGTIKAGVSATETIRVTADRGVSSKSVELSFRFEESNGFAPSPLRLQFETAQFVPPSLTVADVGIDDSNGNGAIDPGELVEVTARIENSGQGRAMNVSVAVSHGENVFPTPESKQSFDLGDLGPGEYEDIRFSLVTNQKAESVPVTADISEKYGEFGKEDVKLPLNFDRPTDQITEVQVEGQQTEVAVQSGDDLSVDIETNIPTTQMDRPDAIAVIIGIRNYSSDGVPNVEYARRDARIMRKYLTQTLGFHEENILPRNPDGRMTYAELRTLIRQKLPSYVKEGTSEVFVFYSGHGAPTTGEDRKAYLVPSDTDPNFVSDDNAYRLSQFYQDLAALNAQSVTVALDACFTGQSGSGEMMIRQASPAVLSVENPFLAIENGTAFLASSSEQVANWYPEKKHGMFTYFFLKGLKGAANQNGDQRLTVAEMESYLSDSDNGVPYYSRRVHQRKQTPQVVAKDKERVLVRYDK